MSQTVLDRILSENDHSIDVYYALTTKITNLLRELFDTAGLAVHSIESRIKSRERLRQKIENSNGKYTCLDDITDLSGVRVITRFSDQVDLVAELVEKEFQIDLENSVDKRQSDDPERFGYQSLHYVVSLNEERLQHTENQRFRGVKAEIQIRSILQHGWAEIEHDLGYRTREAVPREIRRSFSRLAGLLELADLEFCRIRDELARFEQEVCGRIVESASSVPIDRASLMGYIRSSPLVLDLDRAISDALEGPMMHDRENIEVLIPLLRGVGFSTIADVEEKLRLYADILPQFVVETRSRIQFIPLKAPLRRGVSAWYAINAHLASQGLDEMQRAYEVGGVATPDDFLEQFHAAYESVQASREWARAASH